VEGQCLSEELPVAVISVQEGKETTPQTNLHLSGEQSYGGVGGISTWAWSVEQPAGSVSTFVPSESVPNPSFAVNQAGTYLFNLTVWDESGTACAEPAEFQVEVIPDEALHIELLWDTPGDPDQTDHGPGAGADLDLHFTHFFAAGEDVDEDGEPDGWFDLPWDCFGYNPNPNWGDPDSEVDDNPGLDLDDTDGAGPENLNLKLPEEGTYRVGVHYWNDHGFGPSFTSLRIYIYGVLVFELTDVELVHRDMWEVCSIEWPSTSIKLITKDGGNYKIIPDYNHPFFQ